MTDDMKKLKAALEDLRKGSPRVRDLIHAMRSEIHKQEVLDAPPCKEEAWVTAENILQEYRNRLDCLLTTVRCLAQRREDA